MAIGLFDIVNDLTHLKRGVFRQDESSRKAYVPFVVNRAMAQFMDTVLLAEKMNRTPGLDKEMQNDFFLYAVRKQRRFDKWAKKGTIDEDVMIIAEYFAFNPDRAQEAINILGPDVVQEILEKAKTRTLNKGKMK